MFLKTNKYHPLFFLIGLYFLAISCTTGQRQANEDEDRWIASETIRYAEGFSIDYANDVTRVTLYNPWLPTTRKKEPYQTYYLYKNDSVLSSLPPDGVAIKIPLTSLTVNTFAYFEFLDLLNESHVISGVTDGFRIYHPGIRQRMETGEIVDLGDPFNPDIERTMALRPQAIINSAYAQMDRYSERLQQAGFPVIYSLEWMENSPLARAEWIRMVAAFFDKGALADSLFSDIQQKYHSVQEQVKAENKQSILAGDMFQDTWYIPGGHSFNAELFRDAGLDYRYFTNKERGSIGLDIETVLTQFGKADVWVGAEADTYAELVNKDAKYLLLQPVKNRNVYNNRNRVTPSGGNDYFESAIANPHLILSDMVKAAYPHLLPGYAFTYLKPLEELVSR